MITLNHSPFHHIRRSGLKLVQLHLLPPLQELPGTGIRMQNPRRSDPLAWQPPAGLFAQAESRQEPTQAAGMPPRGSGEKDSKLAPRRSQQQVQASQLFDLEQGRGMEPGQRPSTRTTQKLPGRHTAFYRPPQSQQALPARRKATLSNRMVAMMDRLTPPMTALLLTLSLIGLILVIVSEF